MQDYCANLRQESVVRNFQLYLHNMNPQIRPAAEVIAEFMGLGKFERRCAQSKRTQRVIMVAANFRKEVTNTALWLMQFGIRSNASKRRRTSLPRMFFVDIRQVIPTPEAESYA